MNKFFLWWITIWVISIIGISFFIKGDDTLESPYQETTSESWATVSPIKDEAISWTWESIINNTEDSWDTSKENSNKVFSIINDAGQNWDAQSCLQITEKELQVECLDNAYLKNAFDTNDRKFCVKIKNADFRSKCSDNFIYNDAISKNNKEACKKITDSWFKENCLSTLIFQEIESWNYTWSLKICDELSQENKQYCISQLQNNTTWENDADILNNALENNKIDTCSKIKNISLQEWCMDSINIKLALENKDKTKCDWIFDIKKKESCKATFSKEDDKKYFEQAISEWSIIWCGKIKNISMKNQCNDTLIFKESIQSKDKNKCLRILNESLKNDCEKIISQSK